jgi:propionate catabolism operon transcriptional regulator
MQAAVALGRKYASLDIPLAIYGNRGAEKELLAECVHTGGRRAQQPLISINLSSISENDAGRHLLGSDDRLAQHTGLLEKANNGTVILRNLEHANAAVQDCLFDVVNRRQLSRTGGYDPIPVDIRFITLINTPFDEAAVRPDLLHRLSTLRIDHPSLLQRREDIPRLFNAIMERRADRRFDLARYARAKETLCRYSWPGNMFELNAVADRLIMQLSGTAHVTPPAVHRMVVSAIGEERLFADILCRYPGLGTDALPPQTQRAAIEELKHDLGCSNAVLAEKLGTSRTSLWRLTRD